jgi:CBS domain containing-hemolysin-like protein
MPESYLGYRILAIALIVAANAFFAAAEVSLISCRRYKLRALAGEGNLGAQAALSLLANPERLLSVTQVGVTLASLGLGWVGEETLYRLAVGLVGPAITPATASVLHGACYAAAFLAMSFVHVVAGEVIPKNLGLERAHQLAILAAPVLLVFYRISLPFVYLIEKTAAAGSRLLGVHRATHGGGHSAEELQLIVDSSRRAGHLLGFEERAIQRVLEMQHFYAREAMVPRNNVVSLAVNATLDEALRILNENHYSRYPVYEGTPEKIVGVLLTKDLLREWEERRRATEKRQAVAPFQLRRLLRRPVVVPETKPLNLLLDDFRKAHNHLGVVVDEFGTITGIITMEDVLEQIFGEIEDEYDLKRPEPAVEAPVVELEGSINIRDLESQYGVELPGNAGFETLAGFLLFQLGCIPAAGESVEHGGRRFTVLARDRNRISRVRVERL